MSDWEQAARDWADKHCWGCGRPIATDADWDRDDKGGGGYERGREDENRACEEACRETHDARMRQAGLLFYQIKSEEGRMLIAKAIEASACADAIAARHTKSREDNNV